MNIRKKQQPRDEREQKQWNKQVNEPKQTKKAQKYKQEGKVKGFSSRLTAVMTGKWSLRQIWVCQVDVK